MKAIRIHQFGGPEALQYEEAPRPSTGKGEVLIKIHASGVNPIDWKIREGHAKEMFPTTFPLIPGWDVSGEVEEVGESVLNFKKGDEVYGRPDPTKNGTYAEYVVVKADQLNRKPKSINHDKAAGVPLAGLTAWQALFDYGRLLKGQTVLIHGAAGGVGTYAIQLAKWKGAFVTGTASKDNISFLEELGADQIIDYHTDKFEDEVNGADLVIDLIGGEIQKRSLSVIKKGGRLITTVQPKYVKEAKEKDIHLEGFMAKSLPGELQQLADLIDSGKIKPIISEVFPLRDAAHAQALSEKGHTRGKLVLHVL
ncbi:MAG: NADP-dependent oxidoreductase [Ginsengibacter sp.]